MTEPDPLMARIGEGIALRDQVSTSRRVICSPRCGVTSAASAATRSTAARWLNGGRARRRERGARWDLLALTAADLVTDQRAQDAGLGNSVAAFYPSLHLNLGECYRKLGEMDLAREHLDRGRASVNARRRRIRPDDQGRA